jgi:hypothetical protein
MSDTYDRPSGDLYYQEGLAALKAHLRYGTQDSMGFDQMEAHQLTAWLAGLLSSSGYVSIPLTEMLVKNHCNVHGKVRFLPSFYGMSCIALFCGLDKESAERVYRETVAKLEAAGMVQVTSVSVCREKRKKWKKDIPGLSRVKIAGTRILNPDKLSFQDFVFAAGRL